MIDERIILEFDGGSRGNPGPAGIGFVLRSADGTSLRTIGRFIGQATNNVAEYRALIDGLDEAKSLGARRILVRGDSQLIVRQMRGEYRVKNAALRDLFEQAQQRVRRFDQVEFEHNLRCHNALADRLANRAMDRRTEVSDVDESAPPQSADPPPAFKSGDRAVCPQCGCVIEVRTPSPIRPHQLRPFLCQCGAKMHTANG